MYPGHIWAELTEDGETDHDVFSHIISKMRDGIYTEKAFKLRCVPDWRNKYGNLTAKKKDCVTLGELFAPKKRRGTNQSGLRTISEKDRYQGKVDWEAKRQQISDWIDEGLSLGQIAKRLGVSPSTLSEANKRHGLYTPKPKVA